MDCGWAYLNDGMNGRTSRPFASPTFFIYIFSAEVCVCLSSFVTRPLHHNSQPVANFVLSNLVGINNDGNGAG